MPLSTTSASVVSTSSVAARGPVMHGPAGRRPPIGGLPVGAPPRPRRPGCAAAWAANSSGLRTAGGQPDDLERLGMGGDDVQRLGADRPGGAEHDHPATRRPDRIGGLPNRARRLTSPAPLSSTCPRARRSAVTGSTPRSSEVRAIAGSGLTARSTGVAAGGAHTGLMAARQHPEHPWVTVIMVVALVCSVVVVWGLIQITGQSPASSSTRRPSASASRVAAADSAGVVGAAATGPRRPAAPLDPTTAPPTPSGQAGRRHLGRRSPTRRPPRRPRCPAPGCAAGGLDRHGRHDHHRARPVRGDRRNVVVHPDRRPGTAGPGARAPGRSTIRIRCR